MTSAPPPEAAAATAAPSHARNMSLSAPPEIDGDGAGEDGGGGGGAAEVQEVSPCGRFERYRRPLGRGSFKVVFEAYDTHEGCSVAWSTVNIRSLSQAMRKATIQEIKLMEAVGTKSEHLIVLLKTWYDAKKMECVFITELCSGGSLNDYLRKSGTTRLSVVKKVLRQTLEGLATLHEHGAIHRDLKAENVYVQKATGNVRIGDYGLAAYSGGTGGAGGAGGAGLRGKTMQGTPAFMAPEVMAGSDGDTYDEKVDVWSFGLIMVELISGQQPYSECTGMTQLLDKVLSGAKPASFHRIKHAAAREVIASCLQIAPSKRPSARELQKLPFFVTTAEDAKTATADMMVSADTGKDESPEEQARRIVAQARDEARVIVARAKAEAKRIVAQAKVEALDIRGGAGDGGGGQQGNTAGEAEGEEGGEEEDNQAGADGEGEGPEDLLSSTAPADLLPSPLSAEDLLSSSSPPRDTTAATTTGSDDQQQVLSPRVSTGDLLHMGPATGDLLNLSDGGSGGTTGGEEKTAAALAASADGEETTRSSREHTLLRLDSGIRTLHESLTESSFSPPVGGAGENPEDNPSEAGPSKLQPVPGGPSTQATQATQATAAAESGVGGRPSRAQTVPDSMMVGGDRRGHRQGHQHHRRKKTSDFDSLLHESVSGLKVSSLIQCVVESEEDVVALFKAHSKAEGEIAAGVLDRVQLRSLCLSLGVEMSEQEFRAICRGFFSEDQGMHSDAGVNQEQFLVWWRKQAIPYRKANDAKNFRRGSRRVSMSARRASAASMAPARLNLTLSNQVKTLSSPPSFIEEGDEEEEDDEDEDEQPPPRPQLGRGGNMFQ